MTAKENRIKYYGHNDSRAYDEYELKLMTAFAKEYHAEQLRIGGVSGIAEADYWSERCKQAENIWEKSPCDPDITDEQIKAHSEYHNFIKENGSKHYR